MRNHPVFDLVGSKANSKEKHRRPGSLSNLLWSQLQLVWGFFILLGWNKCEVWWKRTNKFKFNKVLSVYETELLSKSLNFCFFPPTFTLTTSELVWTCLLWTQAVLRHTGSAGFEAETYASVWVLRGTFFHERKRHTCSKSENDSNALHALRKDSNIVVSKPDKGNGVVVLNRADYVAKMHTTGCCVTLRVGL